MRKPNPAIAIPGKTDFERFQNLVHAALSTPHTPAPKLRKPAKKRRKAHR
ncbi:MAG: hypothetical protein ACRD2H_01700 [Terriglobales bacterium]